MEEIKVGEYARTKGGCIFKVTEYWLNECKADRANILKHSPNIIDLIEEGDYVNGYICKRKPNFGNKMCNFDLNVIEWTPLDEIDIFYDIVTKEQFNRMKYIVGDERNE